MIYKISIRFYNQKNARSEHCLSIKYNGALDQQTDKKFNIEELIFAQRR